MGNVKQRSVKRHSVDDAYAAQSASATYSGCKVVRKQPLHQFIGYRNTEVGGEAGRCAPVECFVPSYCASYRSATILSAMYTFTRDRVSCSASLTRVRRPLFQTEREAGCCGADLHALPSDLNMGPVNLFKGMVFAPLPEETGEF